VRPRCKILGVLEHFWRHRKIIHGVDRLITQPRLKRLAAARHVVFAIGVVDLEKQNVRGDQGEE
jgi:hypothetical protein